ncbi:hypothetical protein [Phocaeicola plebeius]
MPLTKEERKIIKERLPHGTQVRIANKLKITRSCVSMYFSGLRNSSRIEKEAIKEMKKIKENKQKVKEILYDK